jgi:hypothetical protein
VIIQSLSGARCRYLSAVDEVTTRLLASSLPYLVRDMSHICLSPDELYTMNAFFPSFMCSICPLRVSTLDVDRNYCTEAGVQS